MSFFNKFTQGVSEASNKAKNTIEATKLKTQIAKNNEEINRQYLYIGKEVFELYRAEQLTVTDTLQSSFMQIEDLLNQNRKLEIDIKAIWNEKECKCGKNVPLDAKFCPSCGHQFPIEKPVIIDAQPDATVILGDQTPQAEPQTQKVICAVCDADLEADTKFCGSCGTQV